MYGKYLYTCSADTTQQIQVISSQLLDNLSKLVSEILTIIELTS